MPLSEHEQRLLDQIERALYAEDPKFASNVRGGRLHRPSRRRRVQGVVVFALGLVVMVGSLALLSVLSLPVSIVLGVVGFLTMFGGAMLFWFAVWNKGDDTEAQSESGGRGSGGGSAGGRKKSEGRPRGSFGQRMEERFRRRFNQ